MSFVKDVMRANRAIYELIQKGPAQLFEFISLDKNKIGAGGDRTLRIDYEAEQIFVSYLQRYGKIFSEESGEIGEGAYEMILDPIDGSSNIASGFPYYGTSVSLLKENKPLVSVVSNLCNGETIYKDEHGTFLYNFLQKSSGKLSQNSNSLIGVFERSYVDGEITQKVLSLGIKFRSPGAIALSLAYAHSVNFVIFHGVHREYDIMAGLHICEDLNVHVSKNLIIVSKEQETFERIKELLV